MVLRKMTLYLVSLYIAFHSAIAAASPTETYFPLNSGDVKSYIYDYNGNLNQTEPLKYTSDPKRNGVFIETDYTDGSQTLYENRDGKLLMPGIIDSGEYIWFSQPLVVFTDTVIENGGEYSSWANISYPDVNIFLSAKTIVSKVNKVSVPAGVYYNCRAISFTIKVNINGTSQSIIMNNVWTLAPNVGIIQIEVEDTNGNFVDTAELVSGKVAGIDVAELAGPINLMGAYILLLGGGKEDAYEENDTLATAYYPGSNWEQQWLSDMDGRGVQADDDWYQIYVSPNFNRIQVDLQFTHADGDTDLRLYDASGNYLSGSTSTDNNEFIDYTVPVEGGYYYLKVYYANAGNSYDLWWDDIAPSCPAIPNGNFENGVVSWTEYSLLEFGLIGEWARTSHSGTWYTWLGGDDSEISYIQQQVTVPSSCPYLVFYHQIDSADICDYDYGYVRINGINVETTQLCTTNNTSGWVKKSINLSSYVNQTVTLEIRAETDSTNNSDWFIDDVSFQP